jgi:hypothetical protein
MSDPRHQPGIRDSLMKLNSYWPGIILKFQEFMKSSAPGPGKALFRQMIFRLGRVIPPSAEVFPARKSKPS